MKILYLCTFYYKVKLFRQQMDALIARGHEVRVFSTAEKGAGIAPEYQPQMDDLVKHYECWNKLDRLLFFPRQWKIESKLRKAYQIDRFDLLHAHLMLSSGATALKMKKQYGTKYVVSVRATDLSGFIRFSRFQKLAEKILSEASGILFLSHVHKRELLALFDAGFSAKIEDKCYVIGNCLEPFWEENTAAYRNGIDRSKPIKVLTVARIKPVKNIPAVAKAVQELQRRGYRIELTVIGQNQDQAEYEKLTSYACVHVLPFMNHESLIREYRAHDVFVLPSKAETFGRAYVEAMSQGLPVIYTRDQGFDGNYPDGEVGYAVEPDDEKMIADCIEKVLSNYTELSKNCIDHCPDFYERVIMDKIERFYLESFQREQETAK